ncbi:MULTISPECIES: MFS transporter [Streptomyces]|uniref:MFS transporter n=1 Tax=Streptomyces TaxID=1883 RepID=UPI00163BC831|nr:MULTISPECIES: MFS transporter [Streptomyces]MBC2876513.1 MFS transporter [Streptomyces sp. TYQ1024]UBI40813.1 MFS transporter [Streptomyces mobaraensis]
MALACLLVFTAQMATTVYLPSLPTVAADFGISRGYAALSVSAFVIGAAAPVVLWGAAADRYGRRGPLLVALALFVAAGVLVALVRSPEALLVLRAAQGVGAGGAAIIARILVRDRWSGDELARRLSVLSVAFITAMGGGQFLGGLIGRYAHWEVGFVVLAAVGSVAAALTFAVPFAPGRAVRRPSEVLRICLAIGGRPGFLLPALAGGAGFATIVLLQEVAPFVFRERFGLTADRYGSLGLLLGAAYFAGAMTVNRLVGRVGAGRLMAAGAAVMTAAGAATVVLWSVPGLPDGGALAVFVALYCVTTFGQSVLFPNSMAAAVSDRPGDGAYAVSLCGFLQQSMAGVAAAGAALLHADLAWAAATAALGAAAWLLTWLLGRVGAAAAASGGEASPGAEDGA